jgi:hypothetical protein
LLQLFFLPHVAASHDMFLRAGRTSGDVRRIRRD